MQWSPWRNRKTLLSPAIQDIHWIWIYTRLWKVWVRLRVLSPCHFGKPAWNDTNYKREIIDLYCGDWIKAHREGIDLSLKASSVKLPYKADFCIAGSSPFDLNFIQALKGLEVTRTVIKEDGTYVMLTSCHQGLGNHRWLLDEKMLEIRHKQNADYDLSMTEIIYSTHLSGDELYSYYPKQVKLIGDMSKLRRMIASLDKPGKKGIVLPYSPITIFH